MCDSNNMSSNEDNNNKEERVCRDYVRNICDRVVCKFKHEIETIGVKTLNFCHDYQNTICPRPSCKFIHCTQDDESAYKLTGVMSNQILAEAMRKNQMPGGRPPICNQFRNGLCRRKMCKFRHLTKEQEHAEAFELHKIINKKRPCSVHDNNSNNNVLSTNIGHLENNMLHNNSCNNNNNNNNGIDYIDVREQVRRNNGLNNNINNNYDAYDECDPNNIIIPKRRFIRNEEPELPTNNNNDREIFKGYFASNPPVLNGLDTTRTMLLQEENNMLHKEILQLKRQVSDLTATNEFLLDQNANLRVSNKQRNDGVNLPAVSITNTNAPQMIRTVTASVATVPVSLATVSTCNPVSVSIAGCPTVSMAQPAQILAPSQQILVTTNPTTQLALANSSQAQLAIAQQNLANNLAQQAQQQQPQLTSSQAQQLATLATTTQQLALANTPQQTQQLNQQLTSQAQQLALAANTTQQLALASTNQQLLAAQQQQQQQQQSQLEQQIELHRNNQISTSQAIAMSNATQPMVSYPIMTQSINHALSH